METVITYLKKFLIGGGKAGEWGSLVGYTSDVSLFGRYKVVIIPSPFFREDVYGKAASLPTLPLEEIEGVPFLFGSPQTEWYGDTRVVHADLVASAFFLLSRYEEIRKREIRDAHGRFPGKESLPYKAGFIHRPVVDEYGKLLRKWLRQACVSIPEPEPRVKKIWITHDVDAPFFCRTFRHLIRETCKGEGFQKAWKRYKGPLVADPYYTFPWLLEKGRELKKGVGKDRCESVVFIKSSGLSVYDKPYYRLYEKDVQALISLCKKEKVRIGLHASYEAGENPSRILPERNELKSGTQQEITCNRHHYLASREPEDMDWLEKAGITDDFTLGYADVAGFRLGTCRPVHWINPQNKRVSPLLLHPLTVMDCTLSEPAYMHLEFEEALRYVLQLTGQVAAVNGELVLLWHNDTVTRDTQPAVSVGWQRTLFETFIEELKKV